MSASEKQQNDAEFTTTTDHEKSPSSQQESSVSSEKENYREAPDGGLKAWLVVIGCFCVMIEFLKRQTSLI